MPESAFHSPLRASRAYHLQIGDLQVFTFLGLSSFGFVLFLAFMFLGWRTCHGDFMPKVRLEVHSSSGEQTVGFSVIVLDRKFLGLITLRQAARDRHRR